MPDEVHFIEVIPTTLSGKKLELPVKKILRGAQPDDVASRDSLKDPSALDPIVAIAATATKRLLSGFDEQALRRYADGPVLVVNG